MNEKLKEIVKQAGVFYSYQDQVWELTNGDLERFAELIVRSCAEVASDYDGAHYVGTAINQHFGVEE